MAYNPEIHHRRSVRLPAYDYRRAGPYFVTVCTHGRLCLLDDARIGRVLRRIWARTAGRGHYPREGDFVVMPNHIHGVVWISARQAASGATAVGASRPAPTGSHVVRDPHSTAGRETASVDGSPLRPGTSRAPRGAERGSLGAIIASFKTNAAIAVNNMRGTPGAPVWQRNYFERVIRDEDELAAVRRYIRENPLRWVEDVEHPANAMRPGRSR